MLSASEDQREQIATSLAMSGQQIIPVHYTEYADIKPLYCTNATPPTGSQSLAYNTQCYGITLRSMERDIIMMMTVANKPIHIQRCSKSSQIFSMRALPVLLNRIKSVPQYTNTTPRLR